MHSAGDSFSSWTPHPAAFPAHTTLLILQTVPASPPTNPPATPTGTAPSPTHPLPVCSVSLLYLDNSVYLCCLPERSLCSCLFCIPSDCTVLHPICWPVSICWPVLSLCTFAWLSRFLFFGLWNGLDFVLPKELQYSSVSFLPYTLHLPLSPLIYDKSRYYRQCDNLKHEACSDVAIGSSPESAQLLSFLFCCLTVSLILAGSDEVRCGPDPQLLLVFSLVPCVQRFLYLLKDIIVTDWLASGPKGRRTPEDVLCTVYCSDKKSLEGNARKSAPI